MRFKKPYQEIQIIDCGEPLVAIDAGIFAIASPHPYARLGAPYGTLSPYYLRQGAIERLWIAQRLLQKIAPGWRIQIFDAYRPVEVQQFMVDYTFDLLVEQEGLSKENLCERKQIHLWEQVYQFWAPPCIDWETPPPHSTGAAVDVTLVNHLGQTVDMGGEIDEISPKSYPDYFSTYKSLTERRYHQNRELLRQVMLKSGFRQHPNEWWHFCYGDQMWAWLELNADPRQQAIARYGRIDLLQKSNHIDLSNK